jgi:hypothetical protein
MLFYFPFVASFFVLAPPPQQLVEALLRLAGPGAHECGMVYLGQDTSNATACGNELLSTGKSFWLAVQVQDVDSDLWFGAAQASDGSKWFVEFDSNLNGRNSPNPEPVQVIPCPDLEIALNHRSVAYCPSKHRSPDAQRNL